MIESKLETCPDALSTLILFNGWLGFESPETGKSPSKDELLSRRLVVIEEKVIYYKCPFSHHVNST